MEHSKANRLQPVETQVPLLIYTKLHVSFVTGHNRANNMMAVNDRNSKLMLHTYLLTPWCRVLLEKLTGLQLVKKFPAFYGTRRFITALTSVRHMSLSWASPIQSTYPHPTSWNVVYRNDNSVYEICAKKHGTAVQATDDNIIRSMRFACWVTKATHIHTICNTYCL